MDTSKEMSERQGVRKEIRERIAAYIAGAFGLTAVLAWNDAIKSLIEYVSPLSSNTLLMKFVYALVLTIVVGYVTVYIVRMIGSQESSRDIPT